MGKKVGDVSLIDKWAIGIIGFCIVLLLCGSACFVVNRTIITPKVARLEIMVVQDSLANEPSYSSKEVDSLILMTRETLDSYQQYFQTETTKNEQEEMYRSFGALLLSVIVALSGFFGFKSFKDIKDKGVQTAKEVATKEAKAVAESKSKKAAEAYLKKKLPEVVEKQFEDSFKATTTDSIKSSVIAEVIPRVIQALQGDDGDETDVRPQKEQGLGGTEPMSPDDMFNQQQKTE